VRVRRVRTSLLLTQSCGMPTNETIRSSTTGPVARKGEIRRWARLRAGVGAELDGSGLARCPSSSGWMNDEGSVALGEYAISLIRIYELDLFWQK
jgi:hypothetical protein